MLPVLAHVDTWIFDLDNTLYPASNDLFGLIDARMTAYVARLTGLDRDAAYALQKSYFREHGTTLSGLMTEHDIDPHEFLADVHAIEMDALAEDRRLAEVIADLPGRKLVFTNGDEPYARRVLGKLGLSDSFEAIHDIHACAYQPKPSEAAYASLLASLKVDPTRALFAEDMARNLKPAKALGMMTLWVDNGSEQVGDHAPDFIDFRTDELGGWLASIPGDTCMTDLAITIDQAWETREQLGLGTQGPVRDAVEEALAGLDAGTLRVAEKGVGGWTVNQWLKKAVLLSFRLNDNVLVESGSAGAPAFDKVPSKFAGWEETHFRAAGFRAVPGSIVRRGAFIGKGAVLMPSFVNIGAYVGEGTMVDGWATVGSCAQIGRNVHLSGGTGIGGVLEPLQAGPVVIEDDCFIGARCEVAEGVLVEQGAVLSMGVYLGASTKIVDRASGEIFIGRVPAYSVVVPGSLPGKDGGPGLYCAVIVKRVDAQTRSKTAINELLRD